MVSLSNTKYSDFIRLDFLLLRGSILGWSQSETKTASDIDPSNLSLQSKAHAYLVVKAGPSEYLIE